MDCGLSTNNTNIFKIKTLLSGHDIKAITIAVSMDQSNFRRGCIIGGIWYRETLSNRNDIIIIELSRAKFKSNY